MAARRCPGRPDGFSRHGVLPIRAGPVRPREEYRALPAISEPAAIPVLKAEVVNAEVRVGASPAKRMARAVTTGLTVKPVRPMRKTRKVAVTGLLHEVGAGTGL